MTITVESFIFLSIVEMFFIIIGGIILYAAYEKPGAFIFGNVIGGVIGILILPGFLGVI